MPSSLKRVPGEPIIIEKMSADYHLTVEAPYAAPKMLKFLERLNEPVFLVVDISEVKEISVEDLLIGTELAATSDNAVYRHHNIREVLYVSNNTMIKLAAAGLDSDKFGNIKVTVFDTLEAALQYARENK